jgi:membrane protein implicated in regulation of membrane protease activity
MNTWVLIFMWLVVAAIVAILWGRFVRFGSDDDYLPGDEDPTMGDKL